MRQTITSNNDNAYAAKNNTGEHDHTSATIAPNSDSNDNSMLNQLLGRFQGDFDNYHQVYTDRCNGLMPRDGGGHEHFHCTLVPLPTFPASSLLNNDKSIHYSKFGTVLASYYLDGMPQRIFRLRLYVFYTEQTDHDDDDSVVKMKLYTINTNLETKLRQESADALVQWKTIIQDYITSEPTNDLFSELKRCDIKWTKIPDPIRHAYLKDTSNKKNNDAYHAIMMYDHEDGGVLLESQIVPGAYLRIQDELSLWEDELMINDRGHDANDSTKQIYGNRNGIPYRMKRVAYMENINSDGGAVTRRVVDSDLEWTLGEEWRTNELYNEKMNDIGGATSRLNYGKK